jgi:hypothetical protein
MDLVAIDCHVHPWDDVFAKAVGQARKEGMSSHFRRGLEPVSFEDLANQYRARSMMAVLLNSDDSSASGIEPVSNDHLAKAVHAFPDVFLGFGGVDPWQGERALREVERIKELGLRGLKFNPGRQQFFANDPRFDALWSRAAELDLIVLFHTGMMGSGAGTRGGLGYKLKYVAPIPCIDDVAADHPDLTIISAHPGFPWQDEQLAMVRHKSNVYMDLSGWAPKYFNDDLIRNIDKLISDRVLFGSDWPVLTPERWLEDFSKLSISEESRRKILLENALKLFGI